MNSGVVLFLLTDLLKISVYVNCKHRACEMPHDKGEFCHMPVLNMYTVIFPKERLKFHTVPHSEL